MPESGADRLPRFEDHARQEVRHTTCYMCACRCGIRVTLENGQVRFIQGNPDHPVNRGVLCAKGNAGAMKQLSPGKLRRPLRRREGAERGSGAFEEISWEQALELLTGRLQRIRESDPKRLAFFTGRDQMQALTGLFAQQFGTVNWAAHGGFCSVNMAAAGLYTMGHAFWEFGEPDWDRTRYFMLWGVAEDHASNPIKLGLEKLKRRGAKFVAINPVRTGYQALADEWVPVRPGTDGALALAMVHVLLESDLVDRAFLARYTNAPFAVIDDPGAADHGLLLRDGDGRPQVWDMDAGGWADAMIPGTRAALEGTFETPDGRRATPVMALLSARYRAPEYGPEAAEKVCGVAAHTIRRLALEMATVAFGETVEIPCQWTDWAGRRHDRFVGRPVSMHAMRGISAHSNGFHTCRALHLLQALLGTIDVPGGHRARPPYPKHVPPPIRPARPVEAGEALKGPPLGFPTGPEDLLVDEEGRALRIDKAFSWEAPLAAHGMMHMVITNAVRGDPYPIDTLLLFMANMAWNSSMNTSEVREMLRARDESGEYRIPFIAVVDAFDSETVRYADLVLPDTTYLERHDCISLLDRPISDADAVADSVRVPVIEPDRDVRPWQEVMIEIAVRLGLPGFVDDEGEARYAGYTDFIARYEKAPGVGFLAGWRGEDGETPLRGAPNPDQWRRYEENGCFFEHRLPEHMRFYRFANRDYLEFARDVGFNASADPIVIELYSETLQRFRLAGEGVYPGPVPPREADRARLRRYFDPLPFFYPPIGTEAAEAEGLELHALTQRPMTMYHSWDSQNAWLRQILAQNHLYVNRGRAEALGIADGDWVWIEARGRRVRAEVRLMEGVHPDTVWTWNAIGKQRGTWGLDANANEALDGFLLNHLIDEFAPADDDGAERSNSDPVTGQAAWFDLRVRIERDVEQARGTAPSAEPASPLPGMEAAPALLRYHTHQPAHIARRLADLLLRRL